MPPFVSFSKIDRNPKTDQSKRDRLKENQEYNKENDDRCGSINEQHVDNLLEEGFERSAILRALQISRNNLDMAREILQEFVPKPTS